VETFRNKHFLKLKFLKTVIPLLLLVLAINVTAEDLNANIAMTSRSIASQASGPSKSIGSIDKPTKESLRLTQLIYLLTLESYFEEGSDKYRPEHLLHRHYLRTLLSDWDENLKTGTITSTQAYIDSIRMRKTYLGEFVGVWDQIHGTTLSENKLSKLDSINLGGFRESFLALAFTSETREPLEARILKILQFASTQMLTNGTDPLPAIMLALAFRDYESPSVQNLAREILRESERSQLAYKVLTLTRDLVLPGAALKATPTGALLASRTVNWIKDVVKQTRATDKLSSISMSHNWLPTELLKNFVQIVRQSSSMQKSIAASLAIHGAVVATNTSGSSAATRQSSDNSGIGRVVGASERGIDSDIITPELLHWTRSIDGALTELSGLAQKFRSSESNGGQDYQDFVVQHAATYDPLKLNRSRWVERGKAMLAQFVSERSRLNKPLVSPSSSLPTSSPVSPSNPSLEKFKDSQFDVFEYLLESEQQLQYWPEPLTHSAAVLQHKMLLVKTRMQKLAANNGQGADQNLKFDPKEIIEEFRKTLIENELQNYRGARRTLVSVLLEWGGNCVSQTELMLALLVEFKSLLPGGYEVGFAVFRNHMEAVLVSKDAIWYLVDGQFTKRDNSVTLVRPEALIYHIVKTADPSYGLDLSPFYFERAVDQISPEASDKSIGRLVLSKLKSLSPVQILQSASESGLSNSLGRDFAPGRVTPPSNSPDHALTTYFVSQKASDEGSAAASKAGLQSNMKAATGASSIGEALRSKLMGDRQSSGSNKHYPVRFSINFFGKNLNLCIALSIFDPACQVHNQFVSSEFRINLPSPQTAIIIPKAGYSEASPQVVLNVDRDKVNQIKSLPPPVIFFKTIEQDFIIKNIINLLQSESNKTSVTSGYQSPTSQMNLGPDVQETVNFRRLLEIEKLIEQSIAKNYAHAFAHLFAYYSLASGAQGDANFQKAIAIGQMAEDQKAKAIWPHLELQQIIDMMRALQSETAHNLNLAITHPYVKSAGLDYLEMLSRESTKLLTDVALHPLEFATRYSQMPIESRLAVAKYLRESKTKMAQYARGKLKHALDHTSLSQLKIVADSTPTTEVCVSLEEFEKLVTATSPNLPDCRSGTSGLCEFKEANICQTDSATATGVGGGGQTQVAPMLQLNKSKLVRLNRGVVNSIQVTSMGLVELTLISSGGIELWSENEFKVIAHFSQSASAELIDGSKPISCQGEDCFKAGNSEGDAAILHLFPDAFLKHAGPVNSMSSAGSGSVGSGSAGHQFGVLVDLNNEPVSDHRLELYERATSAYTVSI
jgi:hypothetical protein